MPPKKTTPPLNPEAVHLDFASQEAVLLEVINAEAKKLVDLRKAALFDLQAHTPVLKSTILLMKSAIRALVLLFEDWEPKAVAILRNDANFCSFVRQASAVLFTHQTWCGDHNVGFPSEIAKPVLSLATELKNESKARHAQAATSGTVIEISDSSSSDSSSGGAPSITNNSVVDVDVTMSEPTPARGRDKGKAAIRASAPPSIPTTRKMDYVSVPGMDTGSPAFLRSMALNSKCARAERDLPPIDTGSTVSRTAHRLFPDGGLLEYKAMARFGKAAIRASAPPSIPTTRKMDYVSVPGMDTGSPAFLRSMALNSKRARTERDLPPIDTGSTISQTAHRLFPDGGLLEYIDDRAISNEFISLVLAKTHGAIASFTERAQEEDSLRCAISETRLEMVSVIHKLHIFANYWEILNKEYTALKASLATFCTEKVPKAPEVIPLDPAIKL
ncbi:hypothetical protein EST38_g14108 [Candolleomyces aberdarensis]|uniref:Uncharacterized protein n=1 Tax=Candolleomyces aberdarensis TaxID=2316362 RepID=A0A4Q2CY54_9AGAR|nr:hypothetical protein EST38_g14108 [Candolleomyces aberdarensis]